MARCLWLMRRGSELKETYDVETRAEGCRGDPRSRQHGDLDRAEGPPGQRRDRDLCGSVPGHASSEDPRIRDGGRNEAAAEPARPAEFGGISAEQGRKKD